MFSVDWDPQSAPYCVIYFFFNDTATTEIYTLSLHDALPISRPRSSARPLSDSAAGTAPRHGRSEEHTSELQSHVKLVCRLLLEKKKHIRSLSIIKNTAHTTLMAINR